MIIYGVALLAACYLAGVVLGELLGALIGVDANVGGVGIAMLLLIVGTNWGTGKSGKPRFTMQPITANGITFWNAMYIPIVVAMAAKQNVLGALSSGVMAIVAGVLAVIASFALIPLLAKFGQGDQAEQNDA